MTEEATKLLEAAYNKVTEEHDTIMLATKSGDEVAYRFGGTEEDLINLTASSFLQFLDRDEFNSEMVKSLKDALNEKLDNIIAEKVKDESIDDELLS